MMKKTISLLPALICALALCAGNAAAEDCGIPEENPAETSTFAFPVSANRAVHVDNGDAKLIHIWYDGAEAPLACYVIPEGTAQIRFEISAADNPAEMIYESLDGSNLLLSDLLDPAGGVYSCEQPAAGGEYHYNAGLLADRSLRNEDPEMIRVFLLQDEEYIGEIGEELERSGCRGFRWEYAEAEEPEPAEESVPGIYIIHATDQSGNPVPEVSVTFCTDTSCILRESDDDGRIVYMGTPGIYHVQLVDVPEGYSYDEEFELYTDGTYGEWVLCIRKD